MTLAPLLAATPAIQVHTAAALIALVLGSGQLLAPKATLPHRTLGWIWAGLMMVVAVSSLLIHELRLVGIWSPIHLLSLLVIVAVPRALWAAHRHELVRHRRGMYSLFFGALVLAGAFTLLPGRLMHQVAFGG